MGELTNLNKVCRLCFKESSQEMEELSEGHQIYLKLQLSMGVVIKLLEDPLPRRICKCCSEKVDDIFDFHKKLSVTEELLTQYVTNSGDINKLYFNLINEIILNNKNDISLDDKENKTENISTDNVKLDTTNNDSEDLNDDDDSKNEIDKSDISMDDKKNKTENISTDNVKLDTTNNDSEDLNVDEDSKNEIEKYESNDFVDVLEIDVNCLLPTTKEKSTSLNLTQYKCLTCFEIFESKNLLLHHYNMNHSRKDESLNSGDNFTVVSSVNGFVLFRCNHCNKEYNHRKTIVRHNSRAHVNDRPFICKLCGRTYKTASEIVRHSRAHNGMKLFCSKRCGYSTVYHGALKEHEKRHNKSELKYKCEKCGKGFQVKTWYEQHQNIHTGLKPFVCDICGVAFHMDRYLTSHRSSVHPQSSNLKRYVCVHCSHPCDSQNALTQHLKEHGINTKFLCDLCGKTLSTGKQLNMHKRMHLGEKPFSCSTCNKSFHKKYNLQLHERTHTGEKSHACLLCGKFYSQRSTLRLHNARHHSTEQLKCQKCVKTFQSRNQFTAHKKLCI